MIQELFGGSSVSILGGDTHRSPNLSSQLLDHSPSPSPSPSPSSSTISATTTNTTTTPPAQNLRCPRCDSANTKFCYYNNYNLTQPRHFCKTCRRYWTKGGALRNVPIGGGCRKNKTTTITSTSSKSSNTPGKFIKTELGKSALFNGFEQLELSPNPLLWPSTQNSHLLSLLRANPNPNQMTNPMSLKEDGSMFNPSHFNSIGLNDRTLGLDSLGRMQVPSTELGNSYYRSNQGILLGEAESYNGLQELYQRLKSSSTSATTSCFPDHAPVILGHAASSSNSTAILDSAPVASGAGGFLNPSLYWQTNDMQTTNGAYP